MNVIATIAISITIEIKNAGMVILVGNAARLVTSASAIAAIAAINSRKFWVVAITAIAVNGVRKHPCPASTIASHVSLLSFCFSAHDKNDVIQDDLKLDCSANAFDPVIAYM